jgi:hypothetical protein
MSRKPFRIAIFALFAIFPFGSADAALVADTKMAAQNTLGLVGLYANPAENNATANLGSSATTKNYPLKLTSDGNIAYVNVPWINYTGGYGISVGGGIINATGFYHIRDCSNVFKDATNGYYNNIQILCQENPYINTITVSFVLYRIKDIDNQGSTEYTEDLFRLEGTTEDGRTIRLFYGKYALQSDIGKYCTTYVTADDTQGRQNLLRNVAYSRIVGYNGFPNILRITWMSSVVDHPKDLMPNIKVMIDCTFMYER